MRRTLSKHEERRDEELSRFRRGRRQSRGKGAFIRKKAASVTTSAAGFNVAVVDVALVGSLTVSSTNPTVVFIEDPPGPYKGTPSREKHSVSDRPPIAQALAKCHYMFWLCNIT
jgi:hypothetical protein